MTWDNAWVIPILAALVPVTLYPVIYMTRAWYTTRPGRALMVQSLGILIVIDQAAVRVVLGDFPGYDQIRFVGLSLFAASSWLLLIALIRAPRATPRPQPAPQPAMAEDDQ